MKRARGISLTELIVILVVLSGVAMLGFKLLNPYLQYYAIQRTFKTMAADSELKSAPRASIVAAWSRYAAIDNMDPISGDDILVTREGERMELSASYTVKVPLFANISLLLDFNPTSAAH